MAEDEELAEEALQASHQKENPEREREREKETRPGSSGGGRRVGRRGLAGLTPERKPRERQS